jgi:hypothetical protein
LKFDGDRGEMSSVVPQQPSSKREADHAHDDLALSHPAKDRAELHGARKQEVAIGSAPLSCRVISASPDSSTDVRRLECRVRAGEQQTGDSRFEA